MGLRSLKEYQTLLQNHPEETKKLESFLGVTISRFFRESHAYQNLSDWIGQRIQGGRPIRMLSAGCACGEEPYSLAMLWLENGPPGIRPALFAVDIDEKALDRAKTGIYTAGAMREVPELMREKYFEDRRGSFLLAERVKRMVSFVRADLREFPLPPFLDLITCRNAIYTYLTRENREAFTRRAKDALVSGGRLILGAKERIEPGDDFVLEAPCIYRKTI